MKLDLRVQKTHGALIAALYDLMSKKSFDEITVTELCERAVIRKATFYKHFGDKTELLVYMIRELQRISAEENTIGYNPDMPYSYYSGVFGYLVNFLDSNESFASNVLKSNSGAFVRNLLEEQIRIEIDRHLKNEQRGDIKEAHSLLSAAYAGSIVGCGVWWLAQEKRPEKDKIIKQFTEFVSKL